MTKIKLISASFFMSIFLLITCHYLILGGILLLNKPHYKQLALKEKKVLQIEMTENQLFKNSADLLWKDNNNEVKLNGKFYEVISIKHLGNKCLIELNEDGLETKCEDVLNSLSDGTSQGAKKIILVLNLFQFCNSNEKNSTQYFPVETNLNYFNIEKCVPNFPIFDLIKPPCI